MSKLVVLGSKVNWDTELELKSEDEFGLDIVVDYKDGEKRHLNNCTEFHHRFQSIFPEVSSAFESDIHSDGCTIRINTIDTITITKGSLKHKTF